MNNLDITPQMALAAARVLRDYCRMHDDRCKGCVIEKIVCKCGASIPETWCVPEREDSHEQTN